MANSPNNDDLDDELRPEYDLKTLKGAVRGKYTDRFNEKLRLVRLADDLASAFANEDEVNAALREYLRSRGDSGKAS